MNNYDREMGLRELIDQETIREIADGFVNLLHMGVAILDDQGVYCRQLPPEGKNSHETYNDCLAEIASDTEFPDFNFQDNCFVYKSSSGQSFAVSPVRHECEVIGVIALGPFSSEFCTHPVSVNDLKDANETPDFQKHKISDIKQAAVVFSGVFHKVLKSNFKVMVTSDLHLESVDSSYSEILEKNEQLQESEKKYKDLAENLEQEVVKRSAELKDVQMKLFHSDKMASVGQLAAGVAHEINNPAGFVYSNLGSLDKYLKNIVGFISGYEACMQASSNDGIRDMSSMAEKMKALKSKLKIDYIMDDIQNIISESMDGMGRIKKIVADLKSFSHVDQIETKPADINEGLETTLNVVSNELKYKCKVEKNYQDLPLINCNMGRLNQAFMNLLVNAAHSIEKKGEVTISTRHIAGAGSDGISSGKNGCIEIKIQDTGCGIPEDRLNKIFEPFFTTKEVGQGTGLGLSITYDIIKQHKGEITVQSEVGKGTCFTISIPT